MGEPLMTELATTQTGSCPGWCTNAEADGARHAHVSSEHTVEGVDRPLTASLVQVSHDSEIRVMVNGQVATLEQAHVFAMKLRALVDEATPAAPGLGFVAGFASTHGISAPEMALASGLDVERVRAQLVGGSLLSVREIDQLALAVAHLVSAS
jgi:hypothetical protein